MAWISPFPLLPPATTSGGDQSSGEGGGGFKPGAPAQDGQTPPPASFRADLRVLVVERNPIVALDVEDMLLRNGAAHVTVASNAAEALAALATETFHAGLLDLNLVAGGSLVVAARLDELGVPFAFVTDYGDRPPLPPPFAGRPILGKPCSEHYLVSQLAGLLTLS